MKHEAMVLACCSDIAGKVRGKAFPERDLPARLRSGVGWTPTNVQITCFDVIAPSPWGALGDLVLLPDPATRVDADFGDGGPVERFILGDIVETGGEPWDCCTRSILKAALARLHAVAGLRLVSAFEHEFHLVDTARPLGGSYTSDGFRAQRALAETLVAVAREAGLEPDTVLKEYGPDQYEVTIGPATGVAAADRAVTLRELVRASAERLGQRASFTPLRDPAGVGNGVHIHMSLVDDAGRPVTHDAGREHGLSEVAGRFAAGVLRHLHAIVALTAPSVVSYSRLTPHRWSAPFNNLGYRDREAALRICPVSPLRDVPVAAQYNLEFRACDPAASPYLALAAVVHAGVQGIEDGLAVPAATHEDLSLLGEQVLAARGLARLPGSLAAALERFERDDTVRGWFPARFGDVYLMHKRGEMAHLADMSDAEVCAAYEAAY